MTAVSAQPESDGLIRESLVVPDAETLSGDDMEKKEIKKKLLVFEAQKWIGVREVGGANKGQIVEMFQKAVDGVAAGEPWCAAFTGFVIKTVDATMKAIEIDQDSTALALSEHVMTLWNKAPKEAKSSTPEAGSLVCWQLYKDGKPTGSGHIGIVVKVVDSQKIETIEGNTNDGKGVERDGVGVYKRVRDIAGAGSMKVVGFLKPWC